jgi:hypothetical protein
MKWSYQFWVDAPVETIYEAGFAPERWFTFFKTYRGLESVDPNWLEPGSSIAFRFAVAGPWTVLVKQTVVEHERGRRIRLHEEALSGLYVDDVEFSFQSEDGVTAVTITGQQTSNILLGRVLVFLMYPLNWLSTPRAMRRLKTMIECSRGSPTKLSDEQGL